jgi:hypothetical protein
MRLFPPDWYTRLTICVLLTLDVLEWKISALSILDEFEPLI